MEKPVPIGDETVVYEGKIFEVVQQPMRIGDNETVYETVRRSPGVRLLIVKEGKILLTKEYRFELQGHDYRLPGGKVFDVLKDYKANKDKVEEFAYKAAERESREEAGIVPNFTKHLHTTTPGGTVDWQLYYFLIEDFEEVGQDLEPGEVIETVWKSYAEVKQMCLTSEIQEDRTVGVLLRFLSGTLDD